LRNIADEAAGDAGATLSRGGSRRGKRFRFCRGGRRRQGVEFFAVAAAEDDVIGGERFLEKFHDFGDVAAPLFLAEAFEAAKAEIVFVGFPFL